MPEHKRERPKDENPSLANDVCAITQCTHTDENSYREYHINYGLAISKSSLHCLAVNRCCVERIECGCHHSIRRCNSTAKRTKVWKRENNHIKWCDIQIWSIFFLLFARCSLSATSAQVSIHFLCIRAKINGSQTNDDREPWWPQSTTVYHLQSTCSFRCHFSVSFIFVSFSKYIWTNRGISVPSRWVACGSALAHQECACALCTFGFFPAVLLLPFQLQLFWCC